MLVKRSARDHTETVVRLTEAIEQRGLTVFARIDHAAAAREVGLGLANEELILFGNPRAGTPLMQSDPTIGIELPLRILIWDGADGTQLGWHDPFELADCYDVEGHAAILQAMSSLIAELVEEAGG